MLACKACLLMSAGGLRWRGWGSGDGLTHSRDQQGGNVCRCYPLPFSVFLCMISDNKLRAAETMVQSQPMFTYSIQFGSALGEIFGRSGDHFIFIGLHTRVPLWLGSLTVWSPLETLRCCLWVALAASPSTAAFQAKIRALHLVGRCGEFGRFISFQIH